MKPLSISDIFSNFNFYKENYLTIISDSESYQTSVEDAYICAWPFKREQLYLGDLLQLWFAEKWILQKSSSLFLDQYALNNNIKLNYSDEFYLYQIDGNALTGTNHAKVWSSRDNQNLSISVDHVFKYFCIFKGTSYAKVPCKNTIKPIKSVS